MKKAYRVRKNVEFAQIIGKKHSFSSACFVVYFDLKKLDNARIGISVSKKLGDAVERNKIKRQVREMCYSLVDFDNCSKDLIVIVRKGYLNNDFSNNKNDLEILIKKAII